MIERQNKYLSFLGLFQLLLLPNLQLLHHGFLHYFLSLLHSPQNFSFDLILPLFQFLLHPLSHQLFYPPVGFYLHLPVFYFFLSVSGRFLSFYLGQPLNLWKSFFLSVSSPFASVIAGVCNDNSEVLMIKMTLIINLTGVAAL